jgi:hypothetical protein
MLLHLPQLFLRFIEVKPRIDHLFFVHVYGQ